MPHPIPEGMPGVLAMYDAARIPEHKGLIALCGMLGLRVSEALSIDVGSIDLHSKTLTIRGKGDKTRVIPISDKVWGYLEPAFRRAGHTGGRLVPLSDRSARQAITRIARRAGLSAEVSSHDLRMTFATAAYHNGNDLRAVQELLGHASSATTETYTLVPMEKMKAAAAVV